MSKKGTHYTVFNGSSKETPIDRLPPEAVTTVIDGQITPDKKTSIWRQVAWAYRCIELRANGVKTMPFAIYERGNPDRVVAKYDGVSVEVVDVERTDLQWLIDMPELLEKTEVAIAIYGSAYWEKVNNVIGTRTLEMRWRRPARVNPVIFPAGLKGFKVGARDVPTDEMVYVWRPDVDVEIGEPKSTPFKAVMDAINIILGLDQFLTGYTKRGLVKAHLLKYENRVDDDEAKEMVKWWKRVFSGVSNAHATRIVRKDMGVETIGEGINDLRDNAVIDAERDSIAVGLGVPPSKLLPQGVNRDTKSADQQDFITDTILPELTIIFTALNKQLFWEMGLQIQAEPKTLAVMQQDERRRATAFKTYTDGGIKPQAAADIVRLDLDDDDFKESEGSEPEEPETVDPFTPPEQDDGEETAVILRALAKMREADQFIKWLSNRDKETADLSQFKRKYLNEEDINRLYVDGRIV